MCHCIIYNLVCRALFFTMTPSKTQSKFTRGEKCIFVHLIIIFIVLLITIIIYVVHLGLVKHQGSDIFRITRRSFVNSPSSAISAHSTYYYLVGAVYLRVTPKKMVCNALLLRQQWSLAPAHCVSIYSDPDMIQLMTSWRIKYQFQETEIKGSIVHSQFSRDDFSNNIGLFEHTGEIFSNKYILLSQPFKTIEFLLRTHRNDVKIINWDYDFALKGKSLKKSMYTVRPVSQQKCHEYTSPVVKDLRSYEFCVYLTTTKEILISHGAVVYFDSDIIGFFAWGDKKGNRIPFVIMNIFYYSNWLRNIIDTNNISSIEF